MILGMTTFTFVHVLISLVGILSGLVVLFGLIAGKSLDGWTALFLITTVATSVTGFLFPFHKLLPSHVVGAISLVVLAIAIYARYSRHLAGGVPDNARYHDGVALGRGSALPQRRRAAQTHQHSQYAENHTTSMVCCFREAPQCTRAIH